MSVKVRPLTIITNHQTMHGDARPKFSRPPLCPKPSKATTITITPENHYPFKPHNKNQRLTHQPNCNESISPDPSDAIPPPSQVATVNCFRNKQQKANVIKTQGDYQQYSRKNYFKIKREESNEINVDSRMTEKVVADRSEREEVARNIKSKSAVNYAKYFIKTVSNIPTEPSSQEQNTGHLEIDGKCDRQELKVAADENQCKYTHERGRKTHRAKISERLKSLKANRTNGNKNSTERDLVPSIENRSKQLSAQKSNLNIKNLSSHCNLVAKMKAHSRNRRIVLKVRQLTLNKVQDSLSLLLNSKIDRTHTAQIEIVQKIELHLELLNLLPAYVKQFKQIYQEVECWDELLFLTYKKFYLERVKIHQAMLGGSYSPFRFPFAIVTGAELKAFAESIEGVRLEQKLETENELIRRALQQLYNHIIEKSGRYVNLLQEDNFSQEIYYLMGQQVRLLEEGEKDRMRQIRKRRVGLIIRCCFVIAFLNGEALDIEVLLTAEEYCQRNLEMFQQFLNRLIQ